MSEKNNTNCLITGVLVILGFLAGMYADNFFNKVDYGTPGKPEAAKPIGAEIQKALSHNGQSPDVVFSITRNGSMQAFVPKGAKLIVPKFPLHADNIVDIDTITIYQTSNPKRCWKNGAGDEQCVVWGE